MIYKIPFLLYFCYRQDRQESMESIDGTESLRQRLEQLETENKSLREENRDIKEFLRDYGMVWVGKCANEGRIDHDAFLKKIKELNATAAKHQRLVVQRTVSGAKLSYPEAVSLYMYKDTLEVDGTKRRYSDPKTKKLVRDVMDGYYPIEFKEKYPEGVMFDISDRRNIMIDSKNEPRKDRRISKTSSSSSSSTSVTKRSHKDGDELRRVVLAETGLLVRRKMNQNVKISRTNMILEVEKKGRPIVLPKDTIFLVIRYFDGDRRLILTFSSSKNTKIGDVKRWIEKEWTLKRDSYSLRSSFPSRCYDGDVKLTLRQVGLYAKVNRLMMSRIHL